VPGKLRSWKVRNLQVCEDCVHNRLHACTYAHLHTRTAQQSTEPDPTSTDPEALLAQLEADARLAMELQEQELRFAGNVKELTYHQQQVLRMRYNADFDYVNRDGEEEEEEEVLLDEFGRPIDPRVHDEAQRREDRELAHFTRRMPSKMRNKIAATTGGLTPLHHQEIRYDITISMPLFLTVFLI